MGNGRFPALAVALVLALTCLGCVQLASERVAAYTVHDPIVIEGDAEFTPANGVVGGTGVPGDPYLISGWVIDASLVEPYVGITIINTTAHFVIADTEVGTGSVGIYLMNVSNGIITNVSLVLNSGMWLVECTDIVIEDNLPWTDGFVYAEDSSRITVADNELVGVQLERCAFSTIRNNSLGSIFLHDSVSCTLYSNQMNLYGLEIRGSSVDHFDSHDVPNNNTMDGLEVVYLRNESGLDIEGMVGVGQLILANCSMSTVSDMLLLHALTPLTVGFCYDLALVNLTVASETTSTVGMHIFGGSNVTVSDCAIVEGAGVSSTMTAIEAQSVSGLHVSGTDIGPFNNGLWLTGCVELILDNITLTGIANAGIHAETCSGVTVVDSSLDSLYYGIGASYSEDVVVARNTVLARGFYAVSTYSSDKVEVTDNLLIGRVTGSPPFENRLDSGITMMDTSNSTISRNQLLPFVPGTKVFEVCISVQDGYNVTMDQNDIGWGTLGIVVNSVTLLNISANHVHNCSGLILEGSLKVSSSEDVLIVGNTVTGAGTGGGIRIEDSSGTLVSRNSVSGAAAGVDLYNCTQSAVEDNELWDNWMGVAVEESDNSTIYGNNIHHNYDVGIRIRASENFTIYGNAIVANTLGAEDDGDECAWDAGYPTGGNFWSNYTGEDLFSGPGQNISGSDGIGDTPLVIDMDSMDTYPLMASPYNSDPIASFSVTPPTGNISTVFEFDASSSSDLEDSSTELQVRWDWEDDGEWDTAWSSSKIELHQYNATGDYTVRLEVRDTQNATDSATQVVSVHDDTAPVTTATVEGVMGTNGWYTFIVDVTLTATDDSGVVNRTLYSLDSAPWEVYTTIITISGDGIHTLEFFSEDMDGNQEDVKEITVSIDGTAPTAYAAVSGDEGNLGWFVSTVDIELSASDATSGVDSVSYSVDGGTWTTVASSTVTVAVLQEGTHTLEYYATDLANNSGDVESLEVRIDTLAPETSFEMFGPSQVGSWFLSFAFVELNASDSGSGLNYSLVRVDAGSWELYTEPIVVNGEGTHTVQAQSIDFAGNVEQVAQVSVRIDTLDPALQVLSPTDGAVVTIPSVQVSYVSTDIGSGVVQVDVYLDDELRFTDEYGSGVGSADEIHWISALEEGEHELFIVSKDAVGHSTDITVEFTVDFGEDESLLTWYMWFGLLAIAAVAVTVAVIILIRRDRDRII